MRISEKCEERRLLVDRLVIGEIGSSVFESMVMAPSMDLVADGIDAGVLVSVPVGQVLRSNVSRYVNSLIARSKKSLPGRFSVIYTLPNSWRCSWLQKWQLKRIVRRRTRNGSKYILHCRGWKSAALALEVRAASKRRFAIVNDARGLGWAESAYDIYPSFRQLGDPMPHSVAEQEAIEAQIARESDCVLSVSRKMSEYFTRFAKVDPSRVVLQSNTAAVVDNATYNDWRQSSRNELGLNDELLYVYCGSVYLRQRTVELLKVMKLVLARQPDAKFLVLTTNPVRMKESLVSEQLLDRVFLKSVPFEETGRYLCGSDVGLISTGLFEEPHLANQVCCPVKFSEYIAARCAVVIAEQIGDYSDLVEREGLGIVVQKHDGIEGAARKIIKFAQAFLMSRPHFESKLSAICQEEFSSHAYVKNIRELYARM